MSTDKKQNARHLYAQTDLNKTQIANMLGIHRHTLSLWIRDGDWDRLKASGAHLPSILAENVYHILGQLTEHYLSERRMTNPITHKEADTLYKLACTVAKLRTRSVLNETMEMMGYFVEGLKRKDADLATRLAPHIDEYLSERAHIYTSQLIPESHTAPGGRIPTPTPPQEEETQKEQFADRQENFYSDPEIVKLYTECNIPIPPEYNSLIAAESGTTTATQNTIPTTAHPPKPHANADTQPARQQRTGAAAVSHLIKGTYTPFLGRSNHKPKRKATYHKAPPKHKHS